MPRVFVPPSLRTLTNGEEEVDVEAQNVRQVVDALETKYPGFRDRLCDGDRLKPDLAVSVGGSLSSLGLLQPVQPDDEVHFLPAIGGG